MSHTLKIWLVCATLLCATEAKAQSYTDPGSGSLLFQLLLATFFGALFYLHKLILWIKGKTKDNTFGQ